ncbi:hypothetical protein P167DRAFT_288101 [Morchella conica CCBAS932]|uniref:Hydrophobin n=1 Tax=Morchella conica CCBAS932 TaxID=1392247 RepID=A0A3N4KGZ4_9PEZI|nr:hypothetical protein P167DRAFT_288101 [Morchella conica CCBAS932]
MQMFIGFCFLSGLASRDLQTPCSLDASLDPVPRECADNSSCITNISLLLPISRVFRVRIAIAMSNSLFFSPELRTSLKCLSPPQSSWSITRPCSRLALFFPPGSLFHSDAIINHAGEDLVLVYSLLSVYSSPQLSRWLRCGIKT